MAFFDELGKRLSGTASKVQEMTRDGIELTKLQQEQKRLENEIEKDELALGKLARHLLKDSDDPAVKAIIDKLNSEEADLKAVFDRRDYIKSLGRCPACGTAVQSGSKFCPACGERIPEREAPDPVFKRENKDMEFCPNCGATVRPGLKFCPMCGKPYSSDVKETIIIGDMEQKAAPAEPSEETNSDETNE